MTRNIGKYAILVGTILAAPLGASAQDFFRDYGTSRSSGGIGPVIPSDYSYSDVSPSGLAPLDPNAPDVGHNEPNMEFSHVPNFAIGPIRFSISAGIGVEFNDNITLSEKNRESDIIIRPSLGVEASWRITERNVLRFSLGVGYAKYLDHSQYDSDGVLVSPTSSLEFTFGLGQNITVSLRGRLSYQEDIYDVPTLSNTVQYDRWEAQEGIEVQWDANERLRFNVGYDHFNLWTKQDIFDTQDRAIDTVFLRPSFEITNTVRLGLNASYSFINFDSADRGDGYSVLLGPYLQWQISQNMDLYLEGGYQRINFDGDYTANALIDSFIDNRNLTSAQSDFVRANAADSDTNNDSYYIRFELNHTASETFKQRLSGSKTLEVGFFTNYYDLYHVEYGFDWKALRKTEISPTLFYEYYETSGDLGEEAHRVGAALGIRHYLTNSLTLGLDYRFLYKDSNLDGSDYYQNLGFVSVYYKF